MASLAFHSQITGHASHWLHSNRSRGSRGDVVHRPGENSHHGPQLQVWLPWCPGPAHLPNNALAQPLWLQLTRTPTCNAPPCHLCAFELLSPGPGKPFPQLSVLAEACSSLDPQLRRYLCSQALSLRSQGPLGSLHPALSFPHCPELFIHPEVGTGFQSAHFLPSTGRCSFKCFLH